MKIPKIVSALEHLDDELIAEAAEEGKKKEGRLPLFKWGGIAACLVLAVAVLAVLAPWHAEESGSGNPAVSENVGKPGYVFAGSEIAIEWPWEYKLMWEKYYSAEFDGAEYASRNAAVREALLGEALGSCVVRGEDIYTGEIHSEEAEVFEICGISPKRMVALGKDGAYGVYINTSDPFPATLGEAVEEFGLEEHLKLSRFSECEGYGEKRYRVMEADGSIWELLARCGEAERVKDPSPSRPAERRYLSFTATSEALGVYKRVLYVTEDGYLSTNIFNVGAAYFIGEEAAGEIIRYAKENSAEAEFEPYEQIVAGKVTEVGEEFLLVDTSVLYGDPAQGKVYRVPLSELCIRRYVEYMGVKAGDVVAVAFRGEVTRENVVLGAVSIKRGKLVEDGVAIPE